MKINKSLNFSDLENIPQLIKDFLVGNTDAFSEDRFSVNNFLTKISVKQNTFSSEKRERIFNVFKNQMQSSQLSENQQNNLNFLKSKHTFTITTGHQLNLFTGPVFFIYKILQTIKTCDFLKKKLPEFNFVPVFWMATEDHDFDEIKFFKTKQNLYSTKANFGGAVGRITIDDVSFIPEFENEFKDSVFGTELILMMKEAYKKGNTLAEATRILVNRLFSEYGLLIIDGDDEILKAEMKNCFQDELMHKSLFQKTKKTVEFLTNKYGKVQVNPREINLFYLSETRNRIEFNDGYFEIVDKNLKFTKEEILNELQNHPEKFSPNALLRPVFQETVLPNVAYIGGNAEIMYWLELKAYFKFLNLPFPVLIPRNSLVFLNEKTVHKIEKLNLQPEDFFKNFNVLTNNKLLENNIIPDKIDENEIRIKTNFDELKKIAETTDKSFGNLVKAEEVRQLKSYERMRKRLLRAEKRKQYELIERLQMLYLDIHPSKNWQERVLNFSVFYADDGKQWLDTCLQVMNVDRSELNIIVN